MQNNLALLPPIKRARGYRLYTESKRFVDLYLDGGRAALGHNPPNVLREMKNVAERSLFAPYPSYYGRRFEKALSLLFPGKSFVVYGSLEVVPSAIREEIPVWRPYMDCGTGDFLALLPHPLAPVVVVKPQDGCASGVCSANLTSGKGPVPGTEIGGGVDAGMCPASGVCSTNSTLVNQDRDRSIAEGKSVFTETGGVAGEPPAEGGAGGPSGERCGRTEGVNIPTGARVRRQGGDFPPQFLFSSPVILALTTRAIYDVLHCPERGAVVFGRVNEALAGGPWERTGIYLRLREKVADEEWARIFRRFLDAGFLLPPTQEDPLVLPGELSPGEEKALAECLRPGI